MLEREMRARQRDWSQSLKDPSALVNLWFRTLLSLVTRSLFPVIVRFWHRGCCGFTWRHTAVQFVKLISAVKAFNLRCHEKERLCCADIAATLTSAHLLQLLHQYYFTNVVCTRFPPELPVIKQVCCLHWKARPPISIEPQNKPNTSMGLFIWIILAFM